MKSRITLLILLGLLSLPLAVHSGPSVPLARDLQNEFTSRQLPLMLVFSAEHCPYCELLEEEFLKPMLISGDYSDKVIIRKVELDYGTLIDFKGQRTTGSELADHYDVSVTPTTLFLDAHGRELTKRKVGVGTVEFFGGELDQSIDRARAKLHRVKLAVCKRAGTPC